MCKGVSNQGASLTNTGFLGVIEGSGNKLNIRRPGTWWVGASERSGGLSDWRVSVVEQAIREKGYW